MSSAAALPPVPEPDFQPRVAWLTVMVLMLFYAIAMLDRQILAILAVPVKADLGISDVQLGLLQGLCFALCYCIFAIPMGYAVDRYSRRLVIFAGVIVWAGATTASAFVQSYGELFAARMLVGAGEAALAPAAFSILAGLFPPKRLTMALSVYSMGSLFGMSIGGAFAGWLLHLAAKGDGTLLGFPAWKAVFLMIGAPGLFLSFLIFAIPEPHRRDSGEQPASWADMFRFMNARRRFFICHLGGFSCMSTIGYSAIAWVPTYLVRHFHWTLAQVAGIVAVYGLFVGTFSFLSSGRGVEWLWRRGYTDAHMRFYVAGSVIVAVLGGAAFQAPSVPIYYAVAALAGIFTNMAAIAPAAIQVVTPNALRGRVSAVYILVSGLVGMSVGPALVAALTQYVFADPDRINDSLSVLYVTLGSLAMLFFAFGMRPMRIARAQAVAQGVP
jgi:MFS family permease